MSHGRPRPAPPGRTTRGDGWTVAEPRPGVPVRIELRRDLGPARAASLRDRATRMPRTEVVATVLAAIDAALA